MPGAHLANPAQILERDRLPAARVVGDRHEDDRNHLGAVLIEQPLERVEVHVALERMPRRRIPALGDHQIDGRRSRVLDVGAGRVEVGVVGNDLARAADRREQDLLRGTSLMRRDHVLERKQVLDALEEPEPRRRSGVALVTALDRRPLVARHRTRPRIGQEVDQHVLGAQREQVVPGTPHGLSSLFRSGHHEGLDRVDPERLDDRLERHVFIMGETATTGDMSPPCEPRRSPSPAANRASIRR